MSEKNQGEMHAELKQMKEGILAICTKFMIEELLNTYADEMSIVQKNFHHNGYLVGDYEIIIRKVNK